MNNKYDVPFASRKELVVSIALACFNIALFALISTFVESVNAVVLAISLILLYLLEIVILSSFRQKKIQYIPEDGIHGLLSERSSVVLKNTAQPVASFNPDGVLVWANSAMLQLLDAEENPIGKSIDAIFDSSVSLKDISEGSFSFKDRLFEAESFTLTAQKPEDTVIVFTLKDITALSVAEKKYNDSRVCIAYIAIDNIEDVLHYVHEKFRVAVSHVDEKLKAWADSINATIKSYENDKYIMFFDSLSLDKCLSNRFSILDEIRETRVA